MNTKYKCEKSDCTIYISKKDNEDKSVKIVSDNEDSEININFVELIKALILEQNNGKSGDDVRINRLTRLSFLITLVFLLIAFIIFDKFIHMPLWYFGYFSFIILTTYFFLNTYFKSLKK